MPIAYVGLRLLVVADRLVRGHRAARRPFLVALVRSFLQPVRPVLAGLTVIWGCDELLLRRPVARRVPALGDGFFKLMEQRKQRERELRELCEATAH